MTWLRWTGLALALGALALAPETTPPRALWLWDPAPLLDDARANVAFFDFCERQRIGVVWAQIRTSTPSGSRRLDRPSDWQRFMAAAHRRGMKVHALDGDPHFALREQHLVPLSIVEAVVAYNTAAAPAERFDGIHFDNEPHILLQWRVPRLREQLLAAYLDLNAQASAMARRHGLAYGVDIPFWWQAIDEETKEAVGIVTFHGMRQSATWHLLELVDNLGIMDYRTMASGPDGIVAHATPILERAERVGKARVYVGVETSVEQGTFWFLLGASRDAVQAAIASHSQARTLLERHRARLVDDGAVTHVGVKDAPDAAAALAAIARELSAPLFDSSDTILASARPAFRSAGEWQDLRPRSIAADDPAASTRAEGAYAGAMATLQTPPKVTFAGQSLAGMNAQLAQSETAFAAYRQYAGIAIHDYAAFLRLTEGRRE